MKSTNVRIRAARLFFKILTAVSPKISGRLLARLFLTTRRFQTPERELAWMDGCERFEVRSGAHRLAVWARGRGPVVLLAHGWEGRGSQMAAFLEPLVACGFRVATFDAPGHGQSSGRTSSMIEMSQAVLDVARAVGPVHAIVAHSAGTAAVTVASGWGLQVRRLVYLSPPFDPSDYLEALVELLGLPEAVTRQARACIERRFGMPMATFSALTFAPSMTLPLLAIHDRDDQEVPLEHVRRLKEIWPGARLIETEGLGHRRILREPTIVTTVVEELRGSLLTTGAPQEPALQDSPLREAPRLEPTRERIPA